MLCVCVFERDREKLMMVKKNEERNKEKERKNKETKKTRKMGGRKEK